MGIEMVESVGYARVSSTQQSRQDHITQRKMLTAAGCERIVEERGSGAKQRPILESLVAELCERARSGERVELVVQRLDRVSRSLADGAALLQRLQDAGCGFRSLGESAIRLDRDDPSSGLIVGVILSVSAYERNVMIRRVAEAKAAKGPAARGGRPPVLTPKLLARAKAYMAEGESAAQAAARVGVAKRTLNEHLRRERLASLA